jgi:hypothetical protein
MAEVQVDKQSVLVNEAAPRGPLYLDVAYRNSAGSQAILAVMAVLHVADSVVDPVKEVELNITSWAVTVVISHAARSRHC